MERKRFWKRVIAYMLTLCLLVSGGFLTDFTALQAEAAGTNVYFLNSGGWSGVGAYIYGDKGELLGGWGTTTAEEATELGGDWMKVTVSEAPPYSITFYNKDDEAVRAELYLPTEQNIYVTNTAQSFTTKEDAEKAAAATPTDIYFLNFDGEDKIYENVYAYAYADDAPVAGEWPGVKAEEAAEMGENWWKVSIPRNAASDSFTVIINSGDGKQLADIYITNFTDNYITAKGELYYNQTQAEASVGITYETVMYFLNNKDWPDVNAYVYGNPGEALGGWPGKDTEEAPELGDKWLKVVVPAPTPFNIIFFNVEEQTERTEILIPDEKQIYVTGSQAVYGSQTEAELAEGLGDPGQMTTLHFYNYRQWGDINGYFFVKEVDDKDAPGTTFGAGWPGKAAEPDEETGANWWKISVPRNADEASFYAIFNDGVSQTEDVKIEDKVNVYITPGGAAYSTAEEAEKAAQNEKTGDEDCEEGPNADLAGYVVNYTGAGAALPYTTYEAEAAQTNGEVLEKNTTYSETIQSEASGRQAVKLDETGEYVEFTLTEPANSLVLRYSMPDSADGTGIDATLSLYVNGTKKEDLELTSKYAWLYGGYPFNNNVSNGKPHRYFDEIRRLYDETLPAGTVIRLQKDEGDAAEYYVVDFVETELVAAPLTQPENSLSVTEFGAVADDGRDDYEAFEACIAAAKEQGKEVWIPKGTFDLVEKKALLVAGTTIRGAGMWHTNLVGAGAAFKYEGTSKFFDFAMTGVSTVRDDKGDPAGFEGNGKPATNITIQNIWIEHTKVGVWSAITDRMVIQGCRIRNTYADGINLCSATHDTTVRNNNLRNTGDDCIASWPWLGDCTGNVIEHNTVQIPTLANGIALYGGSDNVIDSNYIADIINNGAGIDLSTEFDIKGAFGGTVTVTNNVLDRCGSMQTDENYPIGAIWFCASWRPMVATFNVTDNTLNDCAQEGILIECNSELSKVNILDNVIKGATDGITVFTGKDDYGFGSGYGTVGRLETSDLTGEKINKEGNPNFILAVSVTEVFDDIKKTDWWLNAVQFAYDKGIMIGKGDSFRPAEEISRQEFVQVLYSNSGKPALNGTGKEFPDVVKNAWYEDAVLWASENGIANGTGDGRFGVGNNITREDLALMLYKYALSNDYDLTAQEGRIDQYADSDKVSKYAIGAMNWAVTQGIISGKGKGGDLSTYRLDPKGYATRAECASMMLRLLNDK